MKELGIKSRKGKKADRKVLVNMTYLAIGELLYRRGARNIKERPGLYCANIDDKWSVECNPHPVGTESVPPWHIAVYLRGIRVGTVGPRIASLWHRIEKDALILAIKSAMPNDARYCAARMGRHE